MYRILLALLRLATAVIKLLTAAMKPLDRGHPPHEREERSDREQHDYRAGGKALPAQVRPSRQRWP